MYRPIPNKLTKQFPEITGLSDFHKLIVTVMKSYSPKRTPNIVTYRKSTNFDKDNWDGLRDHLRDVPQEDIFKLGASTAARGFCLWFQVVIDV